MDLIKELQAIISELEKSVSLNQVAKMSGMNYITLRNIKFAKSKTVTDTVAARLRAFASTFTPPADAPATPRGDRKKAVAASAPAGKKSAKKRGRPKKGVATAPASVAPVAAVHEVAAAPVAKKRGRPKKAAAAAPAAAPVAKKRGRPKKAAAAAPAAAPVAKKRGRPKKAAAVTPAVAEAAPKKAAPKKAAPKKAAPKKTAPKKRGRKPGSVAKPTAAPAATEFTSLVKMTDLKRQIELAEARLAYLRSLEKAEAEFIAKMGGKK